MIVKLLLDRKREGGELAPEEIRALIDAYTRGDVPDYQMAAFAMAVCCRGMTPAETHALTDAMQHSGECLTWQGPSADKHSTGGIGDKLSLIIQPLAASCGISVPSLAGRGLGLTGGTVDKLESIPGYNACLSLDDFRRVVSECGVSIAAQTAEIAPADKKLYALRDVTGTVPSIPLIVGSILSKKLAEGAGTLVFDVKCGAGAFMKTRAEACALARALVDGARAAGRRAAALVTAMDEPLGWTVGNALEVEEAMGVLRGGNGQDARCRICGQDARHPDHVVDEQDARHPDHVVDEQNARHPDHVVDGQNSRHPEDVVEISVELAARMVALEKGMSLEEARADCRENLANGAAWARFAEMVKLHGGDLEAFASRPRGEAHVVAASCAGYVARVDAEGIAKAAFELGAGRAKSDDAIDFAAGVTLAVAHGDRVEVGQPLAWLYAPTRPERLADAARLVQESVAVTSERPAAKQLILEVVE